MHQLPAVSAARREIDAALSALRDHAHRRKSTENMYESDRDRVSAQNAFAEEALVEFYKLSRYGQAYFGTPDSFEKFAHESWCQRFWENNALLREAHAYHKASRKDTDRVSVFLDDARKTPLGYYRAYWPEEVYPLIDSGSIDTISLDHDLGDDFHGTGYAVLKYIENRVMEPGFILPDHIGIHTANPAARKRMQQAIDTIRRLYDEHHTK